MFNSYDELMQAVEERRNDRLILEVDMGATYSPEHEEAKKELAQAKALKTLTGNQEFLSDNLASLEERVAATKPDARSIWVGFKRLPLVQWAALTKQVNLTPIEQFEKVLPDTFIGVWGQDPSEGEEVEPLSTDASLMSTKGDRGILPGGALHQVVQTFMAWQNSGGEVSIRPTKSGQD